MNRAESLKVINAFITELGATPAPVVPPPPAPKKETPAAVAPHPARPVESKGLGSLMSGCAGFEIGSVPQQGPSVATKKEGLDSLIQGCKGFEIGTSRENGTLTSIEVPVAAVAPAPAPVEAPATAPNLLPVEVGPETVAARKAVANLSNKPLLLSLLQYYASESQRANPSRSMLKTTKEQVMKHWPHLTLTPLISALDGAAA
jgi:hypothetical protein